VQRKRMNNALSFIRTVTVGFGLTPNLLTLAPARGARRSRARAPASQPSPSPPVGNSAPP
jgi:hypothetical protein